MPGCAWLLAWWPTFGCTPGNGASTETAAFYTETVGMSEDAARGEAVKNSLFPGTALMYLLGTDQIHDLRQEMTQAGRIRLRSPAVP